MIYNSPFKLLLWSLGIALFLFGGDLLATQKYKIQKAPAKFQKMKNPYTSAEDLKRGKKYYDDKCSDCHGEKGEGDKEDKEVVIFKDKSYMKARSDGQLFFITLEGNGEDATMEGFGPDSDAGMSEKKLWQMIAHIRTLAK